MECVKKGPLLEVIHVLVDRAGLLYLSPRQKTRKFNFATDYTPHKTRRSLVIADIIEGLGYVTFTMLKATAITFSYNASFLMRAYYAAKRKFIRLN